MIRYSTNNFEMWLEKNHNDNYQLIKTNKTLDLIYLSFIIEAEIGKINNSKYWDNDNYTYGYPTDEELNEDSKILEEGNGITSYYDIDSAIDSFKSEIDNSIINLFNEWMKDEECTLSKSLKEHIINNSVLVC